jgi:predicted nucleic acid-binding protein
VPDRLALRVFLDSNVMYSASLDEGSSFLAFWRFRGVSVVVSNYVVVEVARNLRVSGHAARFETLLERTQIVSDADARLIPPEIRLVAKDQPILAAAIAARVDYLVTGDRRHFGELYGRAVSGVRVIAPADFLTLFGKRLPA